jgi:hypothetical protein
MVRNQVGNGIPHFFQPLFARRLFLKKRPKDIQVTRLLLMDYSEKQLFLTVEVGIKCTSRITGILCDLLRHGIAKPVT